MPEPTAPWVDGTIGRVLRTTAERFPDRDAIVFPGLNPDGSPKSAACRGRVAPASQAPSANCTAHAEDSHESEIECVEEQTSTLRGRHAPGTHKSEIRDQCYRRTYSELDAEVDRVARALLGLGIRAGEHVAVWATNWPQWVLLQFATARIGVVLVTVNPAYRRSELSYVLKQSDAVALFLIDRFRNSDYFQMLGEALPELKNANNAGNRERSLTAESAPRLRHVVSMKSNAADGMWNWDQFLALADDVPASRFAEVEATLRSGDAINIQYTSGTTGFPKGAMLTHRNLLLNAFYIGDCQKITADDRICSPVPFYHCFGCVLAVLCCAVYGAALIIPAEHFDPAATLAAIEEERATAIYGVPTMFIAQLEHPGCRERDLSSLRTGIMAGSPCPIEVMKRVVGEMGAEEITIAYGLTEASPVITQTRTDDPLELRVSTVGRMIPGIEVKIVDPETGKTLGDDEQGELCTRGHVVMLGYYNMPEQTAAAIDADGWLHTGDLAVRRPDAYYRITGRIKDMICRGGENVYPREIEEFLFTHPAIEDVAAFGVPDEKYVEEVAAWIKLKDGSTATAEEIREFCRDRMAHFKVPRHIKFVESFPQTVTGKIQKFKMREMMIEELGLTAAETA